MPCEIRSKCSRSAHIVLQMRKQAAQLLPAAVCKHAHLKHCVCV